MNKLRELVSRNIVEYLNEDKYSDPTYRKMMDIYDVPVDFIWEYREFDRCGNDNLYGDEYLKNLTKDIKENGIKKPIILQIDNGKGLVVEGNHRLCIAIKLGLKTIPVQVTHKSLGSINKHKAKPINYNRDKWRLGIWDTKQTIEQLKGIAKHFISNFELPYYEYKGKLNFDEFDKWLMDNDQIINFLIGELEMGNVDPYNNNRNLTNGILNILKSNFNKEQFK